MDQQAMSAHDERLAKLTKIIATWRSTPFDNERNIARGQAERVAKELGISFEAAVARDRARNDTNFYDDWKEAISPGHKEARGARRKTIVERYGSEEAALAPCEREQKLQEAVARWRKTQAAPHERWTHSVDGWSGGLKDAPPHIRVALRNAYPLPESFAAARAEFDYWRGRDQEIEDVLGYTGDYTLDLLAYERMNIVGALIERELVVNTTADLIERVKAYRDRESTWGWDVGDIVSDLERIVAASADAHLSSVDTSSVHFDATVDTSSVHSAVDTSSAVHPSTVELRAGQIRTALEADPSRSDRSIAREFGCSPTTAGRVRASLGLAGAPRSVHRGGQTFEARYRAA